MSDSIPQKRLRQIATPELDALINGFGTKTLSQLWRGLEPGLDAREAERYEDRLVEAAEVWRRLVVLDAAGRAACALVTLQPALFARQMDALGPPTSPAQRAYVVARSILNDERLVLDDAAPFEVTEELSLDQMTRALCALFVERSGWEFEHLDMNTAIDLVLASELTYDSWRDRAARLAKDYEKATYPGKAVSGSSTT